jgi:AmpE protein
MSLIVILSGILIDKFVESVENIRKFDWFIRYSGWTRQQLLRLSLHNETIILLIVLLIPALVIAFIYQRLDNALSLLGFLFSVAVFVFCIGPRDIHNRVHKYLEALEHGEEGNANKLAADILEDQPQPEQESALIRKINETLLITTNNNILGVIFWFVILGPIGAVIYRLNQVLIKSLDHQTPETDFPQDTQQSGGYLQSAQLLFCILNWIPSHLTAITYGVTGNFVDAIHQWKIHRSYDNLDKEAADKMLVDTGFGAIQIEADNKVFDGQTIHDTLGLCRRTIFVWITVIALLTLAGWAA